MTAEKQPGSLRQKIIPNMYRDSVSLMQVSAMTSALPGIIQASVVVASPANLALLEDAKLIGGSVDAGPSDLLIAVEGETDEAISEALEQAELALFESSSRKEEDTPEELAPTSLVDAKKLYPDANIALISTPGEYAAAEALKALKMGLHVMIFSDNVSEKDEVTLKTYAKEHDLLVMGPDCGTAILNGIPLAFANVVRPGKIGVIAASGTGLQQVTSLIDHYGLGITQAVGTGGHDLSEAVGAITMLQSLEALSKDEATSVIVLVSKPPSPRVAEQVVEHAKKAEKPVVVNFLSPDARSDSEGNLQFAPTLEAAAKAAVALAKGNEVNRDTEIDPVVERAILSASKGIGENQEYIRGLFSGGTFCYESLILLSEELSSVYSNTPIDKRFGLDDPWESRGHSVVDLGDDEFTRGRPHPMIDHRLRNERILQEARDPETAVILLDLVLGFGSHIDPASEMVPAIKNAMSESAKKGSNPVFICSICGTAADPQDFAKQERALSDVGVILAESNAQASRAAALLIRTARKSS